MRQIVGSKCAICQERIDSVLEGKICEICENAVHNKCAQAQVGSSPDMRCSACGMDLDQAKALAAAARKDAQEQVQSKPIALLGEYPISKICPKCANTTFSTARSRKWVAFTNDRVCKDCGTRYTPPTPMWGAVVLILAGLGLAGFMAVSLILRVLSGAVWAVPAMACEAFLGFLGIVAIIQGVRGLSHAQ
jgi:hypothetical protein